MELTQYAPIAARSSALDAPEDTVDQIHVRALVIAGIISIALWIPLFKLGETLVTSLFLS
jgi:hypothetical protein